MRYDVELIVSKGGTEYVDNGLWLISPSYFYGQTNWNINNATAFSQPVPSYDYFTPGTIIFADPILGGSVESCTVLSFDALTGDIVTDVGLDFSNLSPIPLESSLRISTLIDSTEQLIIELYENETISQNWRFSDLQTFAPLGSFSRQFRVPATQKNLEILGYLNDVNYSSTSDFFQTKVKAEIRVQTLPIAIGFIRVMRVITQADVLTDFELTFYAESPDLFNAIAGKKLKDIAALADLEVQLTYSEVMSANAATYPYLYSLIERGQQWRSTPPGSELLGSTDTAGTYLYSTDIDRAPTASDMTPALNWKWIFEKIITEAGFTYMGTNIDTILQRYYAPWYNRSSIEWPPFNNIAFRAYVATDITLAPNTELNPVSVVESFDNANLLSSGTFTVPVNGYYTYRIWITVTGAIGSSVRVGIKNVTSGSSYTGQVTIVSGTSYHWDIGNDPWTFQQNAGDQINYYIKSFSTNSSNVTIESGSDYEDGTGWELVDFYTGDGGTIDWTKNAPDVTQAEFLRDVFNMHSCVLVPDRSTYNKLIIEPISTYIGTGESRDWSAKLDISKDIAVTNTSDFQSKRLTFTYSAGEDVGSKLFTNLNRIYGDYKIENFTVSENDVPNDFAADREQKVQLITQSTPSNYIAGTNIIIPKLVDSSGNFVNPKLRCLFYSTDVEMSLVDYANDTVDTASMIPVLSHFENLLPTSFDELDLNWAPESPLFDIQFTPYNNLYNLYWRQYLNEIYSPQCRIMDAHFALDLADILGFKFSDRIWVKNAWWRILEINDYKVGDSISTQVKLLKLVNAVPETSVVPDNVTEGGMIEFIDANGDPASGTRSACERYGYQWDATTNTCRALVGGKIQAKFQPSEALPTKSIIMADNLTSDSSNTYSVMVGRFQELAPLNDTSIGVGNNQTMLGSGGVTMFGNNIYTQQTGFHIGGGYLNNAPATSVSGYSQSGVIMLQGKQTFAAPGQSFVWINGVLNSSIDMPDDTCWNCLLSYSIQDDNFTGNYESGLLSFALTKSGGVAAVSAITPLNVIGGIAGYVFTFGVNVVVTNLHRIGYQVTGTPFPDTFHVSCSLNYTQSKLT